MKKLLFAAALILITGMTFGQDLQKGNVIGLHVITVTLKPGVTMDQFVDFYSNKYIPELEKVFPDVKGNIIKGSRGENENKFGITYAFKSVEVRDKYFPTPDKMSDLANVGFQKMQSVNDELDKLGTFTTVYTDWVVQ